jgi:16S rRNA A1518/A1519 N6-dimethyltransferase RsmA/KsgA/DIM1 with predicted DNA glycosylase/AP lyase activity
MKVPSEKVEEIHWQGGFEVLEIGVGIGSQTRQNKPIPKMLTMNAISEEEI